MKKQERSVSPWRFVVVLALVIPCRNVAATAEQAPVTRYDGRNLALTVWRAAIGPLDSPSEDEAKETAGRLGNRLAREASFETATLMDLSPETGIKPSVRSIANRHTVDLHSVFEVLPDKEFRLRQGYFVETFVESESDTDSYLVGGSLGLLKVWLNGELVGTSWTRRVVERGVYNWCFPIKLKRGRNRLLMSALRVTGSGGVCVNLLPNVKEAVRLITDNRASAIDRLIVPQDGVIALDQFPSGLVAEMQIELSGGNRGDVLRRRFAKGEARQFSVSGLKAGLYELTVSFGDVTTRDKICIGDPEKLFEELRIAIAAQLRDEAGSLNLDTYTIRHRLLMAPESRLPESWEWQRKVVYGLTELAAMLDGLPNNQWRSAPGLHLRAFRSDFDNVVRHYRIFVPSAYRSSTPVGLLVVMATTPSAARQFIASPFVAHQLETEAVVAMAEKEGVAVLWPGYPCAPYGNTPEFNHFNEVMAELEKSYAIDRNRVTLIGHCGGGMMALAYAQKWPTRFAGTILVDPVCDRVQNSLDAEVGYDMYPAYVSWISDHAPLLHMERMAGNRLEIVFDEGGDGHGTLETAQEVMVQAKGCGIPVEFALAPAFVDHMHAWRAAIIGGAKMKRPAAGESRESDFSVKLERAPTVCDAFARPFAVVMGTTGTVEERAAVENATSAFRKKWEQNFYGPCRVVRDSELSARDEREFNLVLIGNAQTNLIWQKYAAPASLELFADKIVREGHVYPIEKASVVAVAKNQQVENHLVVFLGAFEMKSANFPMLNLWRDGWFRTGLWRADDSDSPLPAVAE